MTNSLSLSGIDKLGTSLIRYSLVTVLLWIGAMKFTAYEAEGISGLVSNSPLMSWAYDVMSVRSFSALIGVTEILIALLIALHPVLPRLAALGSLLAIGMFLSTLSFLFTTPGVIEKSLGFPGISVVPGQFLLKDLVLIAAAVSTLGESLRVSQSQ